MGHQPKRAPKPKAGRRPKRKPPGSTIVSPTRGPPPSQQTGFSKFQQGRASQQGPGTVSTTSAQARTTRGEPAPQFQIKPPEPERTAIEGGIPTGAPTAGPAPTLPGGISPPGTLPFETIPVTPEGVQAEGAEAFIDQLIGRERAQSLAKGLSTTALLGLGGIALATVGVAIAGAASRFVGTRVASGYATRAATGRTATSSLTNNQATRGLIARTVGRGMNPISATILGVGLVVATASFALKPVETKVLGGWAGAEAPEPSVFTGGQMLKRAELTNLPEDWNAYWAYQGAVDEVLDAATAELNESKTPWGDTLINIESKREILEITRDAQKQLALDIQSGETANEVFDRRLEEQRMKKLIENERFNQMKIRTSELIRIANAEQRNADAAFWIKYRETIIGLEEEAREKEAAFWLEYNKQRALLATSGDRTSSKLGFGLL